MLVLHESVLRVVWKSLCHAAAKDLWLTQMENLENLFLVSAKTLLKRTENLKNFFARRLERVVEVYYLTKKGYIHHPSLLIRKIQSIFQNVMSEIFLTSRFSKSAQKTRKLLFRTMQTQYYCFS